LDGRITGLMGRRRERHWPRFAIGVIGSPRYRGKLLPLAVFGDLRAFQILGVKRF